VHAPGGHSGRDEAGDTQRGGYVDVDDTSELLRGRVDKVSRDLVGHADIVDCLAERHVKNNKTRLFFPS
jgi:hypothetical protein